MCPIRDFQEDKDMIRFIDSYLYFVFAVDSECRLKIYLLNEEDLENDDNTLKSWTKEIGGQRPQ